MAKIRCMLPNASHEMNGVKFAVDPAGGVVSVDDVPDDLAAIFLSVTGFTEEEGEFDQEAADRAAEELRLKQEKAAQKKAEAAKGASTKGKGKTAKAAADEPPAGAPVTPATETDTTNPDAVKAPAEGGDTTNVAKTGESEE